VVDRERSKLSARVSEGALEQWLLCSGNNSDKQRVAPDLSFAMELKVFLKNIP
jgi:hypothetical protein